MVGKRSKKRPSSSTARPNILPQRLDVWQVDARRIVAPVNVNGLTLINPWLIVVASDTHDRVLTLEVMDAAPTPEEICDAVVGAMKKPGRGKPHRPTEIQIRPLRKLLGLQSQLPHFGIQFKKKKVLPVVDQVFEALIDDLAGDDQPGLLDMPGVTPRMVKALFEAAAHCYRQVPWKKLRQRTIKVECPKLKIHPWYAILTGQDGTPPGLVLYDDLEGLDCIQHGDMTVKEARQFSALAVLFGAIENLPEADQEAVEQYRWKVAGRRAYPAVYRKEQGGKLRSPVAWEQELLAGCLRVLPEFVQRRRKTPLNVASGTLPLVLEWLC